MSRITFIHSWLRKRHDWVYCCFVHDIVNHNAQACTLISHDILWSTFKNRKGPRGVQHKWFVPSSNDLLISCITDEMEPQWCLRVLEYVVEATSNGTEETQKLKMVLNTSQAKISHMKFNRSNNLIHPTPVHAIQLKLYSIWKSLLDFRIFTF